MLVWIKVIAVEKVKKWDYRYILKVESQDYLLTDQMWGSKDREERVKGKSKVLSVRNCKDEVVIYKEVETLRELIECCHRYHNYLTFIVALLRTFFQPHFKKAELILNSVKWLIQGHSSRSFGSLSKDTLIIKKHISSILVWCLTTFWYIRKCYIMKAKLL